MAITALALDTETTKFPNAFPWMPNSTALKVVSKARSLRKPNVYIEGEK